VKTPPKKHNLLVVAHPDDETIFCGGLLQVYRRRPWKVVCVTDGNADNQGEMRRQEFLNACKDLKVKDMAMWDFPDRYNTRLDVNALVERLSQESGAEIFTHGILGEYGHPHHQDVSLAVHRLFKPRRIPVWSMAYNCFAEKSFRLPRKAYERKCKILSQTYFSQTKNFSQFLPAHNQEGFVQVELAEVEALHAFLAHGQNLTAGSPLKTYAWFHPYLENFRKNTEQRPF